MEEELYMQQPPGFEQPNNVPLVCKLQKSLYGLKQAGRNWNKLIDNWMKQYGFIQSHADPCLYTLQTTIRYLAIAIYVDDLISIDNSTELRKNFVKKMSETFKLIDLGPARLILGTKITQFADRIILDQQQ